MPVKTYTLVSVVYHDVFLVLQSQLHVSNRSGIMKLRVCGLYFSPCVLSMLSGRLRSKMRFFRNRYNEQVQMKSEKCKEIIAPMSECRLRCRSAQLVHLLQEV